MEQCLHLHARRIGLFAVLSALSTNAAASSPASTIALLNVQINAAKVDISGNIYIAGRTTSSAGSGAAYIAKLSADGTTIFSTAVVASSSSSTATVLDIDHAGAVYVS